MIGRGSSLPSTTAEEEVIRVPMQNQKAADVRTNVSEKSNEAKTDYPSTTAGLQPNKFSIRTFKGSDKA